jgi:hypothetical protein
LQYYAKIKNYKTHYFEEEKLAADCSEIWRRFSSLRLPNHTIIDPKVFSVFVAVFETVRQGHCANVFELFPDMGYRLHESTVKIIFGHRSDP